MLLVLVKPRFSVASSGVTMYYARGVDHRVEAHNRTPVFVTNEVVILKIPWGKNREALWLKSTSLFSQH